jgi:hypothetical protein
MAEIVNLNRVRKSRKRQEAIDRAAANRARFGRSKADREDIAGERRRLDRELDGKRLDPP